MKLTNTLALIALATTLSLQAQTVIRDGLPALPAGLDRFLMLTPDQIMNLRQHQEANQTALREIERQAGAARQMLGEALGADPVDNATVGGLFVEVTRLQRQATELHRTQLENTPSAIGLTMTQRDKLDELRRALELQGPAFAALSLNLIESEGLVGFPGGVIPQSRFDATVLLGGVATSVPGLAGVGPFARTMDGAAGGEMLLRMLSASSEEIAENVRRIAESLSVVPVASDNE